LKVISIIRTDKMNLKQLFQLLVCLLIVTFSAKVSLAQGYSLSLQDLMNRALEKNTDIKTQEGQWRISRLNRWQSLSLMLPQVDLEGNYIQTSGHDETPDYVGANGLKERVAWLSMQQTIFDAGTLNNISLSKIDQEKEDVLFTQIKQDILLGVIEGYFEALKSKEELKALSDNLEAFRILYEQSTILFNSGVVPELDVKKSQVEYLLQQNSVEQARKNFQVALNHVKELIGSSIGDSLSLRDFSAQDTILGSLSDYLALAKENRSELKSVSLEYQRARIERGTALWGRLPSVSVGAYYGWDTIDPIKSGNRGWQFYANLRLPLWHWGRYGVDRRIAGVHIAQAEFSRQKTQAQIAEEVISVYGDCQLQKKQVGVMQESKKQATDAVSMAQYGYKEGTVTNLDVINTQNLLTQSTIGYLQALYDFYAAKARLYRSIGKLREDMSWLE
jgi:outer membrane protein